MKVSGREITAIVATKQVWVSEDRPVDVGASTAL